MNYNKYPREFVFYDRNSLFEFNVNGPTLNALLFVHLQKLPMFREFKEGEKCALQCYNNAYYICMLMLNDDFPQLNMARYTDIAYGDKKWKYMDDVCALTMGLVYNLLKCCSDKYYRYGDILLKNIYDGFNTGLWKDTPSRYTFFNMVDKFDAEGRTINSFEFGPHPIEAILLSRRDLKKYLKMDSILLCESISELGHDKQTKLTMIERLLEPEKDQFGFMDFYVCKTYNALYRLRSELTGAPMPQKLPWEMVSYPVPPYIPPVTYNKPPKKEFESKITKKADKDALPMTDIQTFPTNGLNQTQQKEVKGNSEHEWNDWLDAYVFESNINAKNVFDTLKRISAPNLKERPRCYVMFRVLDVIKALKKDVHQKDILKWWNAHFNCGWNWNAPNQFKFTNIPKNIKSGNIMDWMNCRGNNNQHYYNYAQELLKALAWNKGCGEYEIRKKFIK